MGHRRLLLISLSMLAATAACVGVLGIEDRPLRAERSTEDANAATIDAGDGANNGGNDAGDGGKTCSAGTLFDSFDKVDGTYDNAWATMDASGGTLASDQAVHQDGGRSLRFITPTANDHIYLERRLEGACAVHIDLWFNADPASALHSVGIIHVVLGAISFIRVALDNSEFYGPQVVLERSDPRVVGSFTPGQWTHLVFEADQRRSVLDVDILHVSAALDDAPAFVTEYEIGDPIAPSAAWVGIISAVAAQTGFTDSNVVNIDTVSIVH